MGAHWFDRLARNHAASSPATAGEGAQLTRRDALVRAGAATLGFGALGTLGAMGAIPAAASATTRPASLALDGQLAACGKCNKEAAKQANKAGLAMRDASLKTLIPSLGITALILVAQVIGNELGYYASLRECAKGVCNPQSYNPAPSVTPATDVETGAAVCAEGTHDCGTVPGTTSHYCCFGSDLCCNGTCCVIEVGCACAPR